MTKYNFVGWLSGEVGGTYSLVRMSAPPPGHSPRLNLKGCDCWRFPAVMVGGFGSLTECLKQRDFGNRSSVGVFFGGVTAFSKS